MILAIKGIVGYYWDIMRYDIRYLLTPLVVELWTESFHRAFRFEVVIHDDFRCSMVSTPKFW